MYWHLPGSGLDKLVLFFIERGGHQPINSDVVFGAAAREDTLFFHSTLAISTSPDRWVYFDARVRMSPSMSVNAYISRHTGAEWRGEMAITFTDEDKQVFVGSSEHIRLVRNVAIM